MASFPARIHVLLARDAPLGLVIRRGPSRRIGTWLWNRDTDRFQLGQWLHGRVYERRSDLSPDGRYWIYFAMNGRWHGEARGSWTAVARAPFLKALALFPKGDCWFGGGLFTGPRTYWLNDSPDPATLRQTGEIHADPKFRPSGGVGGECLSVYYPRLLRDGWTQTDRIAHTRSQTLDLWEKRLPGGWTLRKIAHAELGAPAGKGCYWDEHELKHEGSGRCLALPDWEWADRDRDRLVWAAHGQLRAARLSDDGLTGETPLHDFNPAVFEPIEAPY